MKKYLMIFLLLGLTGCQSTKSVYYWGNYTGSNYDYVVNPSRETTQQYKSTLLNIIKKSESKNKRVPPGIYFELGLLSIKNGKNTEGMNYIDKEKEIYPESEKLVQFLIKQMQVKHDNT